MENAYIFVETMLHVLADPRRLEIVQILLEAGQPVAPKGRNDRLTERMQ